MMPRYVTKTYGRTCGKKASEAESAFDAVSARPSTGMVGVTSGRWGSNSFTSTRYDDTATRKRPLYPEDGPGFGDPFSFDPDDVPASPKRGAKLSFDATRKALSKVEETVDAKPAKTRKTVKSRTNNKSQPTIKALSKKQKTMDVVKDSLVPAKSIKETIAPKSNTVSKADKKQSNGSDTNNWTYDPNEEWDSGESEVIFNSPKKKERLAQEQAEREAAVLAVFGPASSDTRALVKSKNVVKRKEDCFDQKRLFESEKDSYKLENVDSDADSIASQDSKSSGSSKRCRGLSSGRYLKKCLSDLDVDRTSKRKNDVPVVRRLLTSPKKVKTTYNHRQWRSHVLEDADEEAEMTQSQPTSGSSCHDQYDLDEEDTNTTVPRLRRHITWPRRHGEQAEVTKLRVAREHKQLFTVVEKVKSSHEAAELGEANDYQDDVDYLLAGIRPTALLSVRVRSAYKLTELCLNQGFRMHLRAHDVVAQICEQLSDAQEHPALALCLATILFLLSRERLTMDINKQSLQLMLALLDADVDEQEAEMKSDEARQVYSSWCKKVGGLIEQHQQENKDNNSKLNHVTTGVLAMETLLSLTSRKAGEWFKEELRNLSGLDHIILTVSDCVENVIQAKTTNGMDETCLNRLQRTDRCLRVLENVTFMNRDNQDYLLSFKSGILTKSVSNCVALCTRCLPKHPVVTFIEDGVERPDRGSAGHVLLTVLLSGLRVLLNLTHENEWGASSIGLQPALITNTLNCALHITPQVSQDQRFDLYVLALGLLINLVENCSANQRSLYKLQTTSPYDRLLEAQRMGSIEALVALFKQQLESADRMEVEQDEQIDDLGQHLEQKLKKSKRGYSKALPSTTDANDESGMWQESEEGMEWVANENAHSKSIVKRKPPRESTSEDTAAPLESSESNLLIKIVHKAGKHMESSMVAAYVALLLGCLVQDNSSHLDRLKEALPEESTAPLITALNKFLNFMNLTSDAHAENGAKKVERVIEVLETC